MNTFSDDMQSAIEILKKAEKKVDEFKEFWYINQNLLG